MDSTPPRLLQRLLGTMPAADFMARHFLKTPFACPGGGRDFVALGGWEALERLLTAADGDVLVGREGCRREGPAPRSAAEARAILAEGHTIGVRRTERNDPVLAELADQFRQEFGWPVDIHLYCTPAGQPGFGWHYDAEEVFILQTAGSKKWWLQKNTVNPWPLVETLPRNMRHGREIMPPYECLLEAGDWLYIPGGYWHRTEAGGESISLSIGLKPAVALDALDFLRRQLLDSLLWRQRLAPTGEASPLGEAERLRLYRELFAELGADLAQRMADEAFARAFLGAQSMDGAVQRHTKGVSSVSPPGE